MRRRHTPTIRELRAELVSDSIERKRLVDRLVELVRREERDRIFANLEYERARWEQRREESNRG